MSNLGLVAAFAKYSAKLRNVNWSVCAETPEGDLVMSLWQHHFYRGEPGFLECSDSCARWAGPGKNEFARALSKAIQTQQRVRLVVAKTSEVDRIQAGVDASKVAKTFAVREDMIGRVTYFDGEKYVIRFAKAPS